MKIKYYIESQVCRGMFLEDDLYIESNLRLAKNRFGLNRSQNEDRCLMNLTLFKVSHSLNDEDSSSMLEEEF